MSKEDQKDPRKHFSVCYLPWLLGGVLLSVYLVTLNPWVTLLNLFRVAVTAGWTWQPQLSKPLLYLVTLPFHLLPGGNLPVLLNGFSAICAAAVIAMLARCVAILPHDRLEVERQRERSDFSFLTGPLAYIPPILAAGLLGLQLAFWEHATSFTGESFELLLFAGIIWQLLEYRLDEKPWRLYASTFVFGAAMVEDWSFVAYFPVFATAIIWLRGMDFFILRFLTRMIWSGLAGVFILFLLPVLALVSGHYPISFWETLRPELGMDWFIIRSVTSSSLWHILGIASVATLLPMLVISIRWSSNFGDSSRSSSTLVSYLFYVGHAGFLAMCVWLMFDPPFSPKQLTFAGAPGLTLYFISALCLGYFCGFFLVAFGKKPQRSRRSPSQPDPALPQSLMWLCPLIVGGMLAVTIGGLGLLIYKNVPVIRRMNDETLLNYARYATRNLPADGAILLVDNDALYRQPVQAYVIKAMLAREGKLQKYPVVETMSAADSVYQQYLHRQYPAIWPEIFKGDKHLQLNEKGMMQLMSQLAKSNNICYLNPSFGYYFEIFYQEPHGLNYRMKFLPADTLLPPALGAGLIQENEQLWSDVMTSAAPSIESALAPPDPNRQLNFPDQLLKRLHVTPDPNPNAAYAGELYSRGLDYWGVQLQRGGKLDLAATNFLAAQSLNPDNRSAGLNLEFNHELRTGKIPPIDFSLIAPDEYAKSQDWQQHISVDGPIDQVTFAYVEGLMLSERTGLFRQSIAPFTRVRQLAPYRFDVRQRLANAYLLNHLPDRALEVLHDPLTEPARFGVTEEELTGLNTLLAAAYFQKGETNRGIALLESELARRPDDQTLLTATIQTCLTMGFYTNALTLIDRQLKQTPNDPKWAFAQGVVNLQSGHYDPAITSFTRAIDLSTNDPRPRFHRALAYLDSGRLEQARADLMQLQASHTNSFQVAFGLGEIAWRQHDTNEAVRNYEIYLANAKTNTAEAAKVFARLQELKK